MCFFLFFDNVHVVHAPLRIVYVEITSNLAMCLEPMENHWFYMMSERTVIMFVFIFSYLDSVLSIRDRELRTSSRCPGWFGNS